MSEHNAERYVNLGIAFVIGVFVMFHQYGSAAGLFTLAILQRMPIR